jgi:hypothetical protein
VPFYTVFCVFALGGDARVNWTRSLDRIHCSRGEGVDGVNRTREVKLKVETLGLLRMQHGGKTPRFMG